MTIPELTLDDLTWEDLVELGRRAIPAASDGLWTQHGPVDPGITLMELFAYQLEQRLYMLDRVPDTLVRAVFARLIGSAAAPHPARAATVVLTLRADTRLDLPSGAKITKMIDGRELLLTTSAAAVVAPGALVGRVEIDGADRLADLRSGTVMPFFGRSGVRSARLRLTADGPVTEHLLYLGLDGDPEAAPNDGSIRWTADRELRVEDGTGGLRRSGIVRIRAADGLPLPSPLDVVVSRAPDSGPVWPQLTAVVPNAVPAAHRRRASDKITIAADADQAVPNRKLALRAGPIDDPAEFTITAGADERWTVVADLAFSGPDDRHARVDRPGARLVFGDGRSGRIPRWPPGTPIRLDYWTGGGVPPDIGPGTEFVGPRFKAVTVTRLAGGDEPETIAAARARLAGELSVPGRAVTEADVVAIVRAVPGTRIGPVHIRPRRSGDHADVFCVPAAPRRGDDDIAGLPAPALDTWTRDQVAAALERARLIGYRFAVRSPAYRAVEIGVTVDVHTRERAAAERRITAAIRRHLDPLVGGTAGTGHPFGDPVGPPDLIVVAQRALGDGGDVVAVAVGEPGQQPTDCAPLPLRPYELPSVASITVRGRR